MTAPDGHEADQAAPARVLVANRGEIAVRIVRSVAALGWSSCVAHPADEPDGWAVALAEEAIALPGRGPAAFTDVDALADAARRAGCQLLHPGYGFASERPELARACAEAGVTLVGPSEEVLARLGDKVEARELAASLGIPVARATRPGVSDDEALRWWDELGADPAAMVKAVGGGGGRGLRAVHERSDLVAALAETRAAGVGEVFCEELLQRARHVEVQIVSDGRSGVVIGDRDCSVQRHHQKLVEIAPAPGLPDDLRGELQRAALAITAAVGYRGVGTVELLVKEDRWVFLEVNPRLQVEHPVTEAVFGVDLVAAGLRIAAGEPLPDELRHRASSPPAGVAVEARVCAETLTADGMVTASAGTLTRLEAPTGPGVRTDTGVRTGDRVDPRYDTLVAKVIGHGPDLTGALAITARALGELVAEGVPTNIDLLSQILAHPDLPRGVDTGWLERHLGELAPPATAGGAAEGEAVAPVTGTVVAIEVAAGDAVAPDRSIALIEAMKMEHPVPAPGAGVVRDVVVALGDVVTAGQVIAHLDVTGEGEAVVEAEADLDEVRPELDELLARRHGTTDEGRPDVVERRHAKGRRTARENLADLLDPGSFVEYGPLVIAAQTRRRPVEELIERTPGDGVVGGLGRIDGRSVVAMSYDYTVLAGTQGQRGHRKKDRLFELAERLRLPVVLFAEGGGGRPGETDGDSISGLEAEAFALFAGLSGRVPLVGIASGRCFAGNAALLGCCDVIIATPDANIGMGGPAMIEGGGLGVHRPEDVGPVDVQVPNGVIDVLAPDEAAAVDTARQYLRYFLGSVSPGDDAADQRLARHVVPPSRTRVYDVRRAIDVVADPGSVLELRPSFGPGIVTALARIEGRAVGIIANDPRHLGGAIDTPAADKGARFLQLCDAFDLPVLSLVDTPGFMVGPEAEKGAQVRHFSRLFVAGAALTVPLVAVILRKGYGLGAMAMLGGSTRRPVATLAWPTGEIGGMNLEGAVRLAFAKDLAAIEDPAERQAVEAGMVERAYAHGKVLHAATNLEVDDVIDPAETRQRVAATLCAWGRPAGGGWAEREEPKRAFIDTW